MDTFVSSRSKQDQQELLKILPLVLFFAKGLQFAH